MRDVIDYFTLTRLAPNVFPPFEFCSRNREDILEHKAHYRWDHDLLADETSKQHFAKVVAFRLNMDLEQMRGLSLNIDRQYFVHLFPTAPDGVFVDGGGYDGQTSKQFAAWDSTYKRIYYFEPLPAMMKVSRANLGGLRDVDFVEKGLFSRNDRLRFQSSAGQASSLSPTGEIEIEVTSLDHEVQEAITFLKLDIEGAECEALRGAAAHIREEMPTIAVCIYHDQRDFWRVPQRVLEINDGYNLFVRHYTESIRETVMFFVPKSN